MIFKAKELYRAARNHAGFKRYFKNTTWLFGGQMLRLIVGLLVSVAVARYLGPEDFGLYSYILSIAALVGAVSHLGLKELAKRELVESPERRNEIIGTCFVISLLAGIAIYSVMLWIVFANTDNRLMIGLFALLGSPLLISSLSYVELWFQSQVRSDLSVLASSMSLMIFAALKVGAIVQGAGLIVFGYLYLLEMITLCLLQIYFYHRHFGSIFQWQVRWQTASSFLRQSWPLILSGLAITVHMKIDQVMLGAMFSDEAVGQYSVAVAVSSVWHFIPSILATSLFPAILNSRKQSKILYEKRLQNYFDLNVGLAYLIAIPLSITAPWIILLLFGEAYRAAVPILMVHAWTCLFVFLGFARNQYLIAERLFKFSMFSTIAGVIVNIALNFVLIPAYGGFGAAIATCVSRSISTFFSSIFIFRIHSIAWKQASSLFIPIRFLFSSKS